MIPPEINGFSQLAFQESSEENPNLVSPHQAEEFLLLVQHYPEAFRAHMIQRFAEYIVDMHVMENQFVSKPDNATFEFIDPGVYT